MISKGINALLGVYFTLPGLMFLSSKESLLEVASAPLNETSFYTSLSTASYYHALKMTAILYIFLGIFLLVYGPSRKVFGIALVVNLLHAAEHWIFHDQLEALGAPELHLQGITASLLISSAASGVSLLGLIAADGEAIKRKEALNKSE